MDLEDFDYSFEEKLAANIVNYALDMIEDFDPEDKDDILLTVFVNVISGILVATKVSNPNISHSKIVEMACHQIKKAYEVRTAEIIFAEQCQELN